MNKYLDLGISFFKTGLFTFGGGLSMLPIIEKEMVDKRKWITEEEMADIVAIAEATPGAIAVNTATFIGYKIGKFWGSLIATLSLALPSLIIIYVISIFIEQFLALEYVNYAFMGIRCAVGLLILRAALRLFKKVKKDYLAYILILFSLVISLFFTNISVMYIILIGGIVGLIQKLIIVKKEQKEKEKEC